ncbi:MAG: class I SAM-dependent methyltransferase [Acidobacteria bacterium]|nr:class I SAM-dependent methyltransferase [Acidobacteriota bacterium]
MGNLLRSLTTRLQGRAAEAPLPAVPRRASLGLQQFVPLLGEAEHPALLDLGCVWQATVAFFTSAGCKVYAEDLFKFLSQTASESGQEAPLGERFLAAALRYPEGTFRGILAWDLFDYLPDELVEPLAAHLHGLLEPGGALLGLFHNRQEGSFTRYRVLDGQTLELLPGSLPLSLARAYPNRTLLKLFAAFRSSRTFIGRDNLRELLLVK